MIPLPESKTAYVDEEDLLPALLEGEWHLEGGYAKHADVPLQVFIAKRMGLDLTQGTVDHKDRDKLNCRRSNLRMASKSQQVINRKRFGANEHHCITKTPSGKFKVRVRFPTERREIVCAFEFEAIALRDQWLAERDSILNGD